MLLDESLLRQSRPAVAGYATAQGRAMSPVLDEAQVTDWAGAAAAAPAAASGIAVIVCAYTVDRMPVLRRIVATLRAQLDPLRDEFVLVIDHNEALQDAAILEFPGLTVVANSEAPGLSGARNSGVAATTAPVLVFLDDDAVPRPDWLAAWRSGLADPAVMLAGGGVQADWVIGAPPRWFPAEFGWVVGCDYLGMPESGSVIRNPIGANMAVRRTALLAAAGFSADLGRVGTLPAGCEETELGIKIGRSFGADAVRRTTGPMVDHQVPARRSTLRYLLSRCFHEGRSKKVLAGAQGTADSLASERAFVLRALRRGLFTHLAAIRVGDGMGSARALTLGVGTVVTAVGYATGRAVTRPIVLADPVTGPPVVELQAARLQAAELFPATGRTRGPVAPASVLPVTVVVCSIGRDPRLRDTVLALLDQTHPDCTVLVVDNAPGCGRVQDYLEGIADARLSVLPEPRRGLSIARNTGVAAASGEIVAFTDDDAIPDRTWIAELAGVFAAGGDHLSCVTGRVLPASLDTKWEQLFEEYGAFDKGADALFWSSQVHTEAESSLGAPGPRGALYPYGGGEFGSGNNMSFRRSRLLELGGFDPALGAGSLARGGEDLDTFRTVVLAGDLIAYTPRAVVRHFHRDTETALRQQMFGYGVGFAAVVTKMAITDPRAALSLLRRLPAAARVLVSPSSTKNAGKTTDYPLGLTAIELAGYLVGPLLFLRSRRRARRLGPALVAPTVPVPLA